MDIQSLHKQILPIERYGIRAHRLSQAAVAGLPVPEGCVIPDIGAAILDIGNLRNEMKERVKPNQLYALRASPGRPDWGGPYTFLALGMNDKLFKKMAENGDPRVACELYRQAIASFGQSVHGLEAEPFEALVAQYGGYANAGSVESARLLLEATRALYHAEQDEDFPQDPAEQLLGAVKSMARQWMAPTAKILRTAKGAHPDAPLALILQTMVHGLGAKNGVGRIQYTHPETGAAQPVGIFVKDSLTASSAPSARQWALEGDGSAPSLAKFAPSAFRELQEIETPLARQISDAPEIKFVIDAGKLYVTEVLLARRTTRASLRILRDLVTRGALEKTQALLRIDPASISTYLHPQIDPNSPKDVLAHGIAASPGAATGKIVFSSEKAMTAHAQGQDVVLVRHETGPDDIRGMHAAIAVLTMRGGMTSHAAVIARGIGLPCVVGGQSLRIDTERGLLISPDGHELKEGDEITIDGSNGEVLLGAPKMLEAIVDESIDHILGWANETRRMGVRVNADTPDDARRAIRFGVEGIGLCRTEHMFFAEDRLASMRKLILSEDTQERRSFLEALEPAQEADFVELFDIMRGLPVTIRLLDPPLHEFLPSPDDDLTALSKTLSVKVDVLQRRIRALYEVNPMLGMRGIRLGIILPEIYEMQARAIFSAAAIVNARSESPVVPEIMLPLVSASREVELVKSRIDKLASSIAEESGVDVPYRLGVMVETPRAALRAGDLAVNSEFLSMGTNDLTQMTYGLSRDDAGRFMREYVQIGVFDEDPFHTLDIDGVGELVHEAAKRGRAQKPDLILGLCGEHGGDPRSIHFCEIENFDYVSCSPFRVPIAQIAAAQAMILKSK